MIADPDYVEPAFGFEHEQAVVIRNDPAL